MGFQGVAECVELLLRLRSWDTLNWLQQLCGASLPPLAICSPGLTLALEQLAALSTPVSAFFASSATAQNCPSNKFSLALPCPALALALVTSFPFSCNRPQLASLTKLSSTTQLARYNRFQVAVLTRMVPLSLPLCVHKVFLGVSFSCNLPHLWTPLGLFACF